jgi:hypothetical protein
VDEIYVLARGVLLDALQALGSHADAIVVVGAQALYLRVGESDLAVAPYTEDGDLALDPALLAEIPPVEAALEAASFVQRPGSVGVWEARHPMPTNPDQVFQLDLLVPETVSPGRGRRAARLRGHEPTAARIVRGLEGAVVDADWLEIAALDPADLRVLRARVAGPAALLIAKLHKIDERRGGPRSNDKDALDVFRLLRGVPTEELAERMRAVLSDDRSRAAAERGLAMLRVLFNRAGDGASMTARALEGLADEAEVRMSCEILAGDLFEALGSGG